MEGKGDKEDAGKIERPSSTEGSWRQNSGALNTYGGGSRGNSMFSAELDSYGMYLRHNRRTGTDGLRR